MTESGDKRGDLRAWELGMLRHGSVAEVAKWLRFTWAAGTSVRERYGALAIHTEHLVS
jgi:hypothetical protein